MKLLYILSSIVLSDAFSIKTQVRKSIRTIIKSNLDSSPAKIIQDVSRTGVLGKEWSYGEFLANLDKRKIDGVSILSNQNGFGVIDSNHDVDVMPDNIHFVKTIPSMIDNLVDKLNSHHINYDIYQISENNFRET